MLRQLGVTLDPNGVYPADGGRSGDGHRRSAGLYADRPEDRRHGIGAGQCQEPARRRLADDRVARHRRPGLCDRAGLVAGQRVSRRAVRRRPTTVNVPTVANIPQGATIERTAKVGFAADERSWFCSSIAGRSATARASPTRSTRDWVRLPSRSGQAKSPCTAGAADGARAVYRAGSRYSRSIRRPRTPRSSSTRKAARSCSARMCGSDRRRWPTATSSVTVNETPQVSQPAPFSRGRTQAGAAHPGYGQREEAEGDRTAQRAAGVRHRAQSQRDRRDIVGHDRAVAGAASGRRTARPDQGDLTWMLGRHSGSSRPTTRAGLAGADATRQRSGRL